MKTVRNFTYASYLMVRTSYELNPVLTVALGAVVAAFTVSILGIFGL